MDDCDFVLVKAECENMDLKEEHFDGEDPLMITFKSDIGNLKL